MTSNEIANEIYNIVGPKEKIHTAECCMTRLRLDTEPISEEQTIALKKIKGVQYGFDTKGHLVKGIYVCGNRQIFYAFTKKGVYDSKKTSALRKASAYGKDASELRRLLGKPLKETTSDSCMTVPGTDIPLTDVMLTYSTFKVSIGRYPDGSKEVVFGAISR